MTNLLKLSAKPLLGNLAIVKGEINDEVIFTAVISALDFQNKAFIENLVSKALRRNVVSSKYLRGGGKA